MIYRVEFTKTALKQLKKIDRVTATFIYTFLQDNIDGCNDPRAYGKQLKGDLGEYWRYDVGSYRILVEIQDEHLIVLTAEIGHRKDVYSKTKRK